MPQRTEAERKGDRTWYRQPYDYAASWHAPEWGPLDRRFNRHPLRALFQVRAMGHNMGLAWLKAKGFVGPAIMTVEEIHPEDVHWILDMAQVATFSMEWVEHLREAWVARDAKAIEATRRTWEKRFPKISA